MKKQKNNKPSKPQYFSDYFKIDKLKLKELGVFDPILNADSKLFIEPTLLQYSSSDIFKEAYKVYLDRFKKIYQALILSEKEHDHYWKIARKLVKFPEYKFTCIGYGNPNLGKGSGDEFNDKILRALHTAIYKCKDHPDLFPFAPYLEKGIGGDRISDMVQNIIDESICNYTVKIIKELGLKADCLHLSRNLKKQYALIKNPYSQVSIKFLPEDILRDFTISDRAIDIADKIILNNNEIRDIVGSNIGEAFFEANKEYRHEKIVEELLNDEEIFIKILEEIRGYKVNNYDLKRDSKGIYRWLKDAQLLIAKTGLFSENLAESTKSLSDLIKLTISNFKIAIEEKGFWAQFWSKLDEDKIVHVQEQYSQHILSFLSSCILFSEDLKTKIINDNNQLICHFKLKDDEVFLFVKHSDNNFLKYGYEKVLEIADKSKSKYIFLVINFLEDKPKQLESVKLIENKNLCEIFVVDAIIQDSENELATIRFEGVDISKIYQSYKKNSEGGKAKNKETNIIKIQVIKSIFLSKKDLNPNKKVSEICQSILNEFNSMNDDKADIISKKYSIDKAYIEKTINYLDKKDDGGQVEEWCYQINQGKI